ncbi:Ca2+ regulator and membrane fusion protein Fig1-domain-containing protein [Aspergillus nidulans var. acristatus]
MHALQTAMHSILPTPSHPLLPKLRFRSEWRPRWTRGGSQTESEQLEGRAETVEESEQGQTEENEENEDNEEGGQEEEKEEEETNHFSLLNQRRSRPGSPRSSSPSDYIDSNGCFRRRRWPLWETVRGFWSRFFYRFSSHHLLMVFCLVAILFLSLLVAGCSSNRMRAIYLLELSYQHDHREPSGEYGLSALNPPFYAMVSNLSSAGDLTVRVGYFGVCAATISSDNTTDWACRSTAGGLGAQISTIRDPLNILAIADNFRDEIILSVIIIMSIVLIFLSFSALSTFPSWYTELDASGDEVEVRPFPAMSVVYLVLSFEALASLVLIVAVLWQHVAVVAHAATAEAAFGGAIKGDVGAVAMGLGWGAIGAVLLVTFGIALRLLSLKHYVVLEDEED